MHGPATYACEWLQVSFTLTCRQTETDASIPPTTTTPVPSLPFPPPASPSLPTPPIPPSLPQSGPQIQLGGLEECCEFPQAAKAFWVHFDPRNRVLCRRF